MRRGKSSLQQVRALWIFPQQGRTPLQQAQGFRFLTSRWVKHKHWRDRHDRRENGGLHGSSKATGNPSTWKWNEQFTKKMCCGYRVLLSAPSLLAIDFTVFVRFIPFYFHQGKLGCQDLLTWNKPLSLSWLSPSRAGCKRLPGSVWQGRRLPAFTHPSQPSCLSYSGCGWIQLPNLQRTKPETCAWSDTCPPSPLTPKAQQLCPTARTIPLKSIPLSCPSNKPGDPQGRRGPETWVHAWLKTTLAFTLKGNRSFSIYFFYSVCICSFHEKEAEYQEILSNPQEYKVSKNRELVG